MATNKISDDTVMTKTVIPTNQGRTSLMALAFIAVVTALVTVALLFVCILPSAYGIDPTGWGAKLGITLNQVPAAGTIPNSSKLLPTASQAQSQGSVSASATTAPPIDPLAEREDTVQVTIPAQQSLDYRLAMERDYDLNYTWTANGKTVYAELRGESKDGKTPSKTFAKLTNKAGTGLFIIPFNGQFGWHWQNKTDQPITIRLHTKGTYQVVGQVRSRA